MSKDEALQSADYLCDGETYVLMRSGLTEEWDIYYVDEDDDLCVIDFEELDFVDMLEYTKIVKKIIEANEWVA